MSKKLLIPAFFIAIVLVFIFNCTTAQIHKDSSGGSGADVDLSNYYTKSDITALLAGFVPYVAGTGNVTITGTMKAGALNSNSAYTLPATDGSNGYVLKTNGAGVVTWQQDIAGSGGDNLGNHTASQNIKLGSYWLSGDGDNEGLFVTGNGNAGIGTNTPGQKLEVNGNVKATAFIGDGSQLTGLSGLISGGSAGSITKFTGSTAIGNSIIYDNGTNVGIGTTSPGYKLQVNGDILSNGGFLRISGTNGLYWQDYGGGFYMSDSSWIRTFGDKNIWTNSGVLGTNGGLSSGFGGAMPPAGGAVISGNVGIGTASPQASLDIYGTVKEFGTWSPSGAYLYNMVYAAPTDGFVLATAHYSGIGKISGITDNSNSPTTVRTYCIVVNGNYTGQILLPVKKGDYWEISTDANPSIVFEQFIYWIPLGQ